MKQIKNLPFQEWTPLRLQALKKLGTDVLSINETSLQITYVHDV